ncbi:uncharacterized protein CC84DRAFT_764282 [Paraphaeosphaeria sporulosa]|uniref:Uncharacterized protein n=1 Tax=Paraphaeosphaeria sporulosa TaxID=1460663 RepID=A0A177CI21_9PLEO|nr:uncharacterized protein CC84DRAFT_764282 [Paraphaeosphaeria sporulosa]OAG06427.1 hypothetical protein CC84DRAFT_764282 [Paraphaeosphaeria sporulosa]
MGTLFQKQYCLMQTFGHRGPKDMHCLMRAPDSLRFHDPYQRTGAAASLLDPGERLGGDNDDGSLFHGQAWMDAAVRSERVVVRPARRVVANWDGLGPNCVLGLIPRCVGILCRVLIADRGLTEATFPTLGSGRWYSSGNSTVQVDARRSDNLIAGSRGRWG